MNALNDSHSGDLVDPPGYSFMRSFDIGMIFPFVSPLVGFLGICFSGHKSTAPDTSPQSALSGSQTLLLAFRVVSGTETKGG